MLQAQPAEARYLHEAHAITRAQLEALEAAGKLLMSGFDEEARARLEAIASSPESDATTELDVARVSGAKDLAVQALRRVGRSEEAASLDALSMAPRQVSACAERDFVHHALSLPQRSQPNMPALLIDLAVEDLRMAAARLDALAPSERCDEEAHVRCWELAPEDVIRRLADRRFELSLGTFADVIDVVADDVRQRGPCDDSSAFVFGAPLIESQEIAQEDIARAWDWSVLEGLDGLREARVLFARFRAHLAVVPAALRDALSVGEDALPCALAPLVSSNDWISELDARLVMLERDLERALAEGRVIVSRRSPGTL